jgi:hypothetical protein
MTKTLKLNLIAAALVLGGLTACNEGEQISKPINADASASQTADASGASDFDLLQDQKDGQEIEGAASAALPATSMKFSELEWDFGTINEGDNVEHIFTFVNTGSEPLILENCKGSCGCTVPQCPKEPIAPGAKGEIKVVFNSKGKTNMQTKKVTITANTDPVQTILTIKANVTPAG